MCPIRQEVKTLSLFFILSVLVTSMGGCSTARDVTSNPGTRTDFVAYQTYRLRKAVFLFKYNKKDPKEIPMLAELGFGGTSKNLADFSREAPTAPQVAGLLMPGEQVRVTKFIEDKSPTMGTYFEVLATVVSGEKYGTVVKLNLISKERHPTHQAFVDPEYLEPVK